jgi:hypothetical protein
MNLKNPTTIFKIIKSAFFCLIFPFLSFSQDDSTNISINLLTSKRIFLNTKIYENGIKLNSKQIVSKFKAENLTKANRKYVVSKYLLPTGIALTSGGLYLGYDAIKGIPKQVEIGGKIYDYKERSIFQLLGGLGAVAVGVCFIEYSNEFKNVSVDLYNHKLKPDLKLKVGLTPSNNYGFTLGL